VDYYETEDYVFDALFLGSPFGRAVERSETERAYDPEEPSPSPSAPPLPEGEASGAVEIFKFQFIALFTESSRAVDH
jgi:hypothetical protein